MENLKELTTEELQRLAGLIQSEIASRETPEKAKTILFNPEDHFERYNGGWTKTVIGLDKAHTNGFSISGEFMQKGKKSWFRVGQLYLDCGIGGSRKNQKSEYTLFTVDEEGDPVTIATATGRDWATDLWEDIEKYLIK